MMKPTTASWTHLPSRHRGGGRGLQQLRQVRRQLVDLGASSGGAVVGRPWWMTGGGPVDGKGLVVGGGGGEFMGLDMMIRG